MDAHNGGDQSADELARLRAENVELRARMVGRATVRSWLAIVLVVLASISTTASVVAAWAHGTVFDTDRFTATIAPALDDPAFYSAISARVSDEALIALDLGPRVEARLGQLDEYLSGQLVEALGVDDRARELLSRFDRPTLAGLAPPIVDGLEARVEENVDRIITSEQFRQQFPLLVERLHRAGVALVRGDSANYPNVYTEAGEVRLNLVPTIVEALRGAVTDLQAIIPDIPLPDVVSEQVDVAIQQMATALATDLPEDFGQVTIISEQDLTELQSAARLVDRLVWAIIALSFVLIAASIAVSPARRRTVIQIGLGTSAGLVVAWLLIGQVQDMILARITNTDGAQAVSALFASLFADIRSVWLAVGAVAVLSALVAHLAGRPRWMTRGASWVATQVSSDTPPTALQRRIADDYDMARLLGGAAAVVAVLLIGLTPIPLVVVGGLLALYLWWLRAMRQRAVDAPSETVGSPPVPQPTGPRDDPDA